jgi:2-iminobutanoate/2-iminopropanoate deaminase
MKKVEIIAKNAPPAIGPYSQAVRIGNFIFCSGQVGKDPKTNSFVDGGIKSQTEQILENLNSVLGSAGAKLSDVVKTTVYLKNVSDFLPMNEVYATYFQKPYPARATIEAARLPQDALVEIECIAYKD